MHSLEFESLVPYSRNKSGLTVPVRVAWRGQTVEFDARIDTGAEFCVFDSQYADALGLDLEAGIPLCLGTATGTFTAFGHDVVLHVAGFEFESTVYFSVDPIRRSVLGLTGFLDRFVFALDHSRNVIYITPAL